VDEQAISDIVGELRPRLVGRVWGKVFLLSRTTLAVDFRTGDGCYLLVSTDPSAPRLHMIARTVRELEKLSAPPSPFVLVLRKALGGAVLKGVVKDEGDRVVRLSFAARDAAGREQFPSLVAQLTGRSANLFLLDGEGRVVDSLRPARGEGQEAGETYRPPAAAGASTVQPGGVAATVGRAGAVPARGEFATLSEALDDEHRRAEERRAFDARAAALTSRTRQAAEKRRKLLRNLEQDLARHGDAPEHRRAGDLLLANIATAVREGGRVRLTDYYAEGAPVVELEVNEGRTLQEEAARRFALYAKARRAAEEVAGRIEKIKEELGALELRRAEIERAVAARDAVALDALAAEDGAAGRVERTQARKNAGSREKAPESIPGARRFRSTDGYEILVGRKAADNDRLTFRVARSQDLWLHAADYPGSHVVVRNQRRGEPVPHRTVIEAARLAAHFSRAGKDAKVAVNYTERKYVSKIKGGAPGLVRLSSLRTLLVEPAEALERI
jgi:predicted ribosome quality control (RQC) complex YloA/Tae2 family protein